MTDSATSADTAPEIRLATATAPCQADSALAARMGEIFAVGGLLARYLPDYEPREGQLSMAQAVAATLDPETAEELPPPETSGPERAPHPTPRLLVEAGTGTGKTLAYLVPAVLSGRRVVVSTNTINLQEQILAKEIPFIQRYLAPWLQAMCVKGRGNYLCLRRWHQFLAKHRQGQLFTGNQGGAQLEQLAGWVEETDSGDKAELSELADDSPLWASLNAAGGHCLGSSCPHGAECFITTLRRKAARAHLLIVNHHLFFSDLAVRRFGHAEVLPRYEAVVFDEAHHLENIATRHFGLSLSHYQLLDLVRDLESMAEERLRENDRARLLQHARALGVEADRLNHFFPASRGRFPLPPLLAEHPDWPGLLEDLRGDFRALANDLEGLAQLAEIWNPPLRRVRELADTLEAICQPPEDDAGNDIYWYERLEKTVFIGRSPIDIAPHLREHLHNQVKATVFTSATLRTGKDFRYVKNRLGLPADSPELALETPFDYAGRTLLYVPSQEMPPPGASGHPEASRRLMRELVQCSRGRALLLFTSLGAMRQAAAELAGTLPYPLLIQGDAPRQLLLEQFRRRTGSVLLAVASFWEGVDVPGESLSCVIIDKLPFEVPSDPVIMARVEKIKKDGGNPFFDFQVPRAVLMLRQGVGRLLRSTADRGVLAILDGRLFSKSYGRIFLQSLPPSPVCRELARVREFFADES